MDVEEVRRHFPALARRINGRPVLFADNASTTLKSVNTIGAVARYYMEVCANVHRGTSAISREAEACYEGARAKVARFINAQPEEVVFVRNTTHGINLASHLMDFQPGDEVVSTLSEHHSNILPWTKRARVHLAALDRDGRIDPHSVARLINRRTRLVALGHVSNVTGLVNPVRDIIEIAKRFGIPTLVDAAQSAPHMKLDVKELGCDFLAFSGHKLTGPSGIGILYVRREILEGAEPDEFGGGMVAHVQEDGYQLEGIPYGFEAGTPNIEGAIGLGTAIDFLEKVGMEAILEHSLALGRELLDALRSVPRLRVYPECSEGRIGIACFVLPGIPANELTELLSTRFGIMTRSGHHCAEPLVRHLGQQAMTRVSLYLYNTPREIRYITDALELVSRDRETSGTMSR